jgi:hypothetical protein
VAVLVIDPEPVPAVASYTGTDTGKLEGPLGTVNG